MATIGEIDAMDPAETEFVDVLPVFDFESFYRSHHQSILRVALALTRDSRAAEDLTQDAFLAARKDWPRIGSYDKPHLWVRRVLINMAASRFRRLGREAKAMMRLRSRTPDQLELATPDPELWEAIASLSNRQTQVIVLVVIEDLPVDEVAEILNCGPESVRTHLRRARARLADLLQEKTHETR